MSVRTRTRSLLTAEDIRQGRALCEPQRTTVYASSDRYIIHNTEAFSLGGDVSEDKDTLVANRLTAEDIRQGRARC